MTMLNGFWGGLSAAAVLAAAFGAFLHWCWRRRFAVLQRELSRFSEDLLQLAELQTDAYQKMHHRLHELEEKILELSVPTSDGPLPLERRHQVLTLARKGASVDEISSRLNMPKGEAELILSLRRYADPKPTAAAPALAKAYGRAGF